MRQPHTGSLTGGADDSYTIHLEQQIERSVRRTGCPWALGVIRDDVAYLVVAVL